MFLDGKRIEISEPLEREVVADAAADESAGFWSGKIYRTIALPVLVGVTVSQDVINSLQRAATLPETPENIFDIIIAGHYLNELERHTATDYGRRQLPPQVH